MLVSVNYTNLKRLCFNINSNWPCRIKNICRDDSFSLCYIFYFLCFRFDHGIVSSIN